MQTNSIRSALRKAESLTTEERSFLQGDDRSPEPGVAQAGRGASKEVHAPPVRPLRRRARKANTVDLSSTEVPYSSNTFSLPCTLLDALRDASHRRKKLRRRPFHQQELVREALVDWLTQEGFWPPDDAVADPG